MEAPPLATRHDELTLARLDGTCYLRDEKGLLVLSSIEPMTFSRAVTPSKWCVLLLLSLFGSTWGCSTNLNVRVRRLDNGLLQVDGPMAGPFPTLEALATNACEFMTSQPGASNGKYGSEYCALYYHSRDGGGYFLSYLSDIKGRPDSVEKSCSLPSSLSDPNHEDALVLGGAHTHPHNRRFSPKDTSVWAHWIPTRFVEKKSGQVFDRKLLMFFRERTGECRAYSYNNFSRIISALRDGEWVPIGKAYTDNGDVEMFEGKDWLP